MGKNAESCLGGSIIARGHRSVDLDVLDGDLDVLVMILISWRKKHRQMVQGHRSVDFDAMVMPLKRPSSYLHQSKGLQRKALMSNCGIVAGSGKTLMHKQ